MVCNTTTLLRHIWALALSHLNGIPPMTGVMVPLEVPPQETSIQWWGQSPLGADNTTDSLLTMRGVRSALFLTTTLPKLI